MEDFEDAQAEHGGLPLVVPSFADQSGEPGWTIAYVIISWYLYQYYGDRRLLQEHYESYRRWVENIAGGKPALVGGWIGDWLPPSSPDFVPPEGNQLHNTASYYQGVHLVSKIADLLGHGEDAARYGKLAAGIRELINERFLDTLTNTYHGDVPTDYRQGSNAVPLLLGIVPEDRRNAVVGRLIDDIMVKHKGHLNTGFPSTKAVMELLPEIGRADVAYTVASQTTYPGWIYPILEYGATTVPEW